MNAEKKSFIVYHDIAEQVGLLSAEQRGDLFMAMLNYSAHGAEGIELDQITKIVFIGIKAALDRDAIAYKEKCAKNAENGKKGGRPKKYQADPFPSKTERFFQKPKKADNDNDNDNDNEKDIDNDNDIDNGVDSGADNDNKVINKASASYDSVSCSACAPLTLEDEEKYFLIARGVPPEYIQEKAQRASEHAAQSGKPVFNVLLEWWDKDGKSARWREIKNSRKPAANEELHLFKGDELIAKNTEIDDWFEKKLNQTW